MHMTYPERAFLGDHCGHVVAREEAARMARIKRDMRQAARGHSRRMGGR